MTLAEVFHQKHKAYLFEDAHFLVEAAAATEGKELVHNVFQFSDKSVLKINRHSVETYASIEAMGLKAVI